MTEPEQAIHIWLGDLPIAIPTRLIRAALYSQVPDWVSGKGPIDARTQVFRGVVKAAAKAALSFMEAQLIRANASYPAPDHDEVKKDALSYAVRYFLDLILYGLCGQEWDALYVQSDSGDIEITGLTPYAGEDAGVGAAALPSGDDTPALPGPATESGEPEESGEAPASAEPYGDGGGTLVHSGDIWERQDNVREAAGVGTPDSLA